MSIAPMSTTSVSITSGPTTPKPTTPPPTAPMSSTLRPTTPKPTTPKPTTANAGPAGLARFYSQHLAWGSCAGFTGSAATRKIYASTALTCARLTVPLAYADPAGPTVTVGVLRKRATRTAGRIGSLVIDPGGPGGSGMQFVAQEIADAATSTSTGTFATTMRRLSAGFDLVGIDPRGVGMATPAVHCSTDAQRDAQRADTTRPRTPAQVATANADGRKYGAACAASTGRTEGIDGRTLLANVGTRDVARDLDVLRAALGDRKLTYLGFSYGTRIGYTYAEQFPHNVRAILFDGDMSPIGNPTSLAIGQHKALQAAFDSFTQWCATTEADCALGKDPSRALGIYQTLVRPLLDTPVKLGDRRVLSFDDAISGTTISLYYEQLRPTLAKALADLQKGDGDLMMALADFSAGRDSKGHYSNEDEALIAVTCVDGPRLTDPAKILARNEELLAAAPYMTTGDPAVALADSCASWPVPATSFPHRLKIVGLPRTLVVSTTGDPATPYAEGVELAKELDAILLTAKAVRHTSFLGDDPCVNALGTDYLLTLALPPNGGFCY